MSVDHPHRQTKNPAGWKEGRNERQNGNGSEVCARVKHAWKGSFLSLRGKLPGYVHAQAGRHLLLPRQYFIDDARLGHENSLYWWCG